MERINNNFDTVRIFETSSKNLLDSWYHIEMFRIIILRNDYDPSIRLIIINDTFIANTIGKTKKFQQRRTLKWIKNFTLGICINLAKKRVFMQRTEKTNFIIFKIPKLYT